jgi:hypothetical protein
MLPIGWERYYRCTGACINRCEYLAPKEEAKAGCSANIREQESAKQL